MFDSPIPIDQTDEATPPRLIRQGGDKLLHTVTSAYLDHFERRVDELEQAIEHDERVDVLRIAHTLRSSSLLVGLTGLAERFSAIERAAESDSWPGPSSASRTCNDLRTAFGQVRPWIERHTGR